MLQVLRAELRGGCNGIGTVVCRGHAGDAGEYGRWGVLWDWGMRGVWGATGGGGVCVVGLEQEGGGDRQVHLDQH